MRVTNNNQNAWLTVFPTKTSKEMKKMEGPGAKGGTVRSCTHLCVSYLACGFGNWDHGGMSTVYFTNINYYLK